MRLVIWTEDPDSKDLVPLRIDDVKEIDLERTETMQMTSTQQGTIIVREM